MLQPICKGCSAHGKRKLETALTRRKATTAASPASAPGFQVDHPVDFKPVQGKAYEVTGELTKESTCVWVADVETKQPVTEKVCAK
jgi:hypothetical protein